MPDGRVFIATQALRARLLDVWTGAGVALYDAVGTLLAQNADGIVDSTEVREVFHLETGAGRRDG